MKRSFRMTIQQATKDYERWLAGNLEIVPEDLALKHERMRQAAFAFLRATYYRWAQLFPQRCKELGRAPQVLAVGDLHVENFGTWRDAEGRLVWGINDFDETWRLPYPHDLVRLATSAHLAIAGGHLRITAREACDSILSGYREGLEASGRAFVLAERSQSLREMATARLRDPHKFWERLESLPTWKDEVPPRALKALSRMLPRPDLPRRVAHRVAGMGSLGRQRFVAIADWQGGKIAREAKALAPSAAVWAHGSEGTTRVLYQTIVDQAVRSADPWVKVRRRWIVRRLAPDCTRIELSELPEEREETHLLSAMGWETANVHLGSRSAHALLVDLAARQGEWLHQAAKSMLEAVQEDWEAWQKSPAEPVVNAAARGAAALVVLPPIPPAAGRSEAAAAGPAAGGAKGAKSAKAAKGSKRPKVAKTAKAAKGSKDAKPAKGARAGKGAKGAKAAKRAKDAKDAKATKEGKSAKAAKGAKSAKSAKTAKGAAIARPPKEARSAKAAKGAVSGQTPREAKAAKAGKGAKRAETGKGAKTAKARKRAKSARVGSATAAQGTQAARGPQAADGPSPAAEATPATSSTMDLGGASPESEDAGGAGAESHETPQPPAAGTTMDVGGASPHSEDAKGAAASGHANS
jgi:hypothetical protein